MAIEGVQRCSPVYVRRYGVTTQSRVSNPFRAFVIDTNDVLTMVVSNVDKNKLSQMLHDRRICQVDLSSVRLNIDLRDCENMKPPTFEVGWSIVVGFVDSVFRFIRRSFEGAKGNIMRLVWCNSGMIRAHTFIHGRNQAVGRLSRNDVSWKMR